MTRKSQHVNHVPFTNDTAQTSWNLIEGKVRNHFVPTKIVSQLSFKLTWNWSFKLSRLWWALLCDDLIIEMHRNPKTLYWWSTTVAVGYDMVIARLVSPEMNHPPQAVLSAALQVAQSCLTAWPGRNTTNGHGEESWSTLVRLVIGCNRKHWFIMVHDTWHWLGNQWCLRMVDNDWTWLMMMTIVTIELLTMVCCIHITHGSKP